MESYTHLSYQERSMINIGLLKGASNRQIAESIGRVPSTVSRELRRNGGDLAYHPFVGEQRARTKQECRKGKTKIGESSALQVYIEEKLNMRWSPKVIAACWNRDHGGKVKTSSEAIYQWIYSPEQQHKELCKLLRRHKKKRGIRRSRASQPVINKVHIKHRSAAAEQRTEVGHCEADLVFCEGNQSVNVLTVIDRATRTVAIIKNESKHSEVIENAIKHMLPQRLPFEIKTLTFDNGTEFARHQQYQVPAYFCDPHSPWQKGSVEKFNEQLRAYLPFQVSLDSVTQEQLDQIATHINNIPREILNFRSPLELIKNLFYQNPEPVALNA
jgi:IS30 family transposase